MEYRTKYKRLIYLLQMLEKGFVKNPSDISRRFECSDKTARRMLNDLREEGHTIGYSKQCKKYLLIK